MAVVTGDQYLESLVKFVEKQAEKLIEGTIVLKLNPVGLRYVQSRLEALEELESLLAGAPVDYLRAYVSDLGDHRALEQLRRILGLIPSLKLVSVLPPPARDPTPLFLLPFGRLKVLELQGCDLSTSSAKGLLELRFTLEKLICHNSTDALRHVFVSRIAEIKDSPQWNRLSFVSCAVNSLILMDESLQLLPAVETLDLSRNKFAKVDNLRKCSKLKHLDLGFNSLRSIASLREVSCQIVKLVLRNNALTTLRGIENLKSLEGLDLSYNIISNFSEIEILADLPSLQNLWLEGNPLCCARWFRAQVFSFFPHPEILKLDNKTISASEFWNRQIIVASRQKQPSSFGFYSPAKDNDDLEGSINTKRKRISRLVNIESEDQSTSICSEEDSASCDNEIQSKDENATAGEEAGIEDFIKRIERMKRERSVLWLQEFKEWMEQTSKSIAVGSNFRSSKFRSNKKDIHLKTETKDDNLCETSRCISDAIQLSGDESSTFFLESETSFADTSTVISTHQYSDRIGEASSRHFLDLAIGDVSVVRNLSMNQEEPRFLNDEGHVSGDAEGSWFNPPSVSGGDDVKLKDLVSPSTLTNNITGSAWPRSPPHYQEDILHRRHNLEEEFLQLSAESLSVASTDSNTSCSEDDSVESGPYITHTEKSIFENLSEMSANSSFLASFRDSAADAYHDSLVKQNGAHSLTSAEGKFSRIEGREMGTSSDACSGSFTDAQCDDEISSSHNGEIDWLEKKQRKWKAKRRMVSLLEEEDAHGDTDSSKKSSDHEDICQIDTELEGEGIPCSNDLLKTVPVKDSGDSTTPMIVGKFYRESFSGFNTSIDGKNNSIGTFFNLHMADSNEAPMQYMECSCLFMEKSGHNEREVVVIRSSKSKLHILLIIDSGDGSGTSLEIIGSHRVRDVREVFVGLGVQTLRVYFEGNTSYLFITRCLERARELMCVLDIFDSSGLKDYCSMTSLENIQINLFEEHVCGGSKINLFQYSMVLFWHNNLKEDSWLSRSLFVLDEHLLVCTEDLMQFGRAEDSFSSNYFDVETCCAIANVSEMVIGTLDSPCVTLVTECSPLEKGYRIEDVKKKPASGVFTWKLKWFSEESLLNFIALVKAIHAQVTSSSLLVRCKS